MPALDRDPVSLARRVCLLVVFTDSPPPIDAVAFTTRNLQLANRAFLNGFAGLQAVARIGALH